MRRLFLAVSLASVSIVAAAEAQYFVVLGSYSTWSQAEEARGKAAVKMSEPYTLASADTPRGTFHRVLAGPYLDKGRAASVLEKARVKGFVDAWLLAERMPIPGGYLAAAGATNPLPPETQEVEDRLLSRGGDPYDAPVAPERSGAFDEAPETDDEQGPILVEEAPPGYDLHRLRRSAAP